MAGVVGPRGEDDQSDSRCCHGCCYAGCDELAAVAVPRFACRHAEGCQCGGCPADEQPQVPFPPDRLWAHGRWPESSPVRGLDRERSFLWRVPECAQYPFAVVLGTHVAQLPVEVPPQPPEEQRKHDAVSYAEPSRENDPDHSRPLCTVGLGLRTCRCMCGLQTMRQKLSYVIRTCTHRDGTVTTRREAAAVPPALADRMASTAPLRFSVRRPRRVRRGDAGRGRGRRPVVPRSCPG